MSYKHGIEVIENKTSFPNPLSTRYGVQVVLGTAPVNLAENPYEMANKPVKAANFEEAAKLLGYSDDWDKFTLCESMYASFKVFQVSPVIFINVLDAKKHSKDVQEASYQVVSHQVILINSGILKDTVKITALQGVEDKALSENKDFIMDFNSAGDLVITLLSTGNAYETSEVKASFKVIAPDMVKEEDLIGFYNVETGEETGMEVLRQIYPKYGLIPGVLLAPGWTVKSNIGAALQAKCEGISGIFRTMCLLDLDTKRAKKYADCLMLKKEMGYDEEHSIVLWPKVMKDGKQYSYSAIYGAMMSYYTVINGDVPYVYPSNKLLNVDGAVLADGTEVLLDQVQAGELNGSGIVTAFHDNGWKSFGNNTGCYPGNTDPKDRWIGCRRMFDFVANYFITVYRAKLDEGMNKRMVDDIINSFNIWGNSLMASGMCAGLYAEYRKDENTISDILAGHMKVRIHFAPYTPAEYIQAIEEFDVTAFENAMVAKEE
ncbi:MAG TPA: phage tail protein [Lachnoclostridium sp.]|uniref:phage tail sheath family protein n=1 Tax=Lacrimispora sp. TaxID=2719234 RepID=UPI000ED50F07|nr:phage tail sheath family protein [Lacrimispora sp.]HCD43986.1 phage tail protein [Lachnoclostridium sp.]